MPNLKTILEGFGPTTAAECENNRYYLTVFSFFQTESGFLGRICI